jgi:hypothetical protein
MTTKNITTLKPYARCELCACYCDNLAKQGINIPDECSNGMKCYVPGDCHCFHKYHRTVVKHPMKVTIHKISDRTIHKAIHGIIRAAKQFRSNVR